MSRRIPEPGGAVGVDPGILAAEVVAETADGPGREVAQVTPGVAGVLAGEADLSGQLREAGLRATQDESPDKIGAKIRRAQIDKVPYMLVVGPREAEEGKVSVRHSRAGDLGAQTAAEFLDRITGEVARRELPPTANG